MCITVEMETQDLKSDYNTGEKKKKEKQEN